MIPSNDANTSFEENLEDCVGYVYCPPEWDQLRLTTGPESQSIV
jgi:hypothetical protein